MAVELTRVSRLYVEIDVAATLPGGGSATITGVDVALLPIGAGPDASTVWTAATYAAGTATVLLAGPDAGGSGAIVVPSDSDLWAKVTDAPEIDAAKVTRVSVKGGTVAVMPVATVTDTYVAGLVSGATATRDALRQAYGRAAPVLSNFNYESGTGNLLQFEEDGILIVLTYNTDGTVATSKRGTDATQTYSYSGGNLTGVA